MKFNLNVNKYYNKIKKIRRKNSEKFIRLKFFDESIEQNCWAQFLDKIFFFYQ